jgi:hypothetical protein
LGETSTARRIAEVLEILTDGEWHGLDDIRKRTKLRKHQVLQIIGFLEDYKFIMAKETKKEIKLKETVRKFLTQGATA